MKKVLLILIILFTMVGCGNKETKSELDAILSRDNYVIIDVRTKEEFETGHIKGAENIPYEELENSELDKNKEILVYCKSGARSKIAYDILTNLGYIVYDLGSIDNISMEKE